MPIEISQRELLPKVHLALEAVKRNYRVYLCDFFAARALFKSTKKPVIFFHKSTWEAHAKHIKGNGHHFVFLDEEMGLAIPLNKLKDSLYNRWGHHVTSDKYDALFTIGPTHQDVASQVIGDKYVTIHETGWPRFDLWRPDFAPHLSNPERPHPRTYYLFASSFGATNSREFAAKLKQIAQIAPQILQLRKDREKSFYLCLNLLRELAHHLKKEHTDLVIRPHNSESPDEWQQLFNEHSNVHIRRGGDLYSWLSHANSVLHATSTVGIQCALTGKTPIALCPVGTMKDTNQYHISHEAHTIQDIITNKHRHQQPNGLNAVRQLVTGLDGRTAAQNILDCLDNMHVPEQPPLTLSLSQRSRLRMYFLAGRSAARIPWRQTLAHPKFIAARKYYDKLDGGITTKQVQEAISYLSSAHEICASEILVRTPAPNLFSIEHTTSLT